MENDWYKIVEIVKPHVVRISTPRGSGTGFLISNSKTKSICSVATAAHVIDNSHYWEEPIRIEHLSSGKSLVIRPNDRAIFLDSIKDTSAILFDRNEIPFPPDPLELAPKGKYLKVGFEIGWFGFPAIQVSNLCFFKGTISSFMEGENTYLVDGVAINGVSGGPAINILASDSQEKNPLVIIMGVVSAYIPNRATGETLPGLSVIRDVSQFHELLPTFASIDQAKSVETQLESQPEPSE